ncbi:MAG TPA: alpha-glucosidase [Terriglobales bacterium]|nr:alpha-glucosidase [Terriglobales bacterium]
MTRKLAVLFSLALFTASLFAQKPSTAVDDEGHQWWQHAVFYELYPRSFADSNNDGIGDLNGINQHLDYLHWLGVDAVWITPMFPSPQVDFGYDVSDYENVDPKYGTLADMDSLIANGKKNNIKFILDFVVNHTSDKHPWFIESESSKTNPKRDWYIWRDGKGANQPPNNWNSTFGGSAWKFDPKTNQYYYHYFYAEQPDLNWRNPAVEKAMFDTNRFWYKKGIAGFRLDAVDTMYEDPNLKDNPYVDDKRNAYGDRVEKNIYNTKLPEVHEALKRLRSVADEYNAVLIGETWTADIKELEEYYGGGKEIQMPMDFMLTKVDKLSPPDFRKQIAAVNSAQGWPVYVLSNHDIVRYIDRYGNAQNKYQVAKLLSAMYLTLRGTPILYYGEEIGMENNDPKRREDVQDPIGRRGWPKEKGRDGERTPMQWNSSANAGFSTTKPWNAVDPKYKTYNVEVEKKDPNSILNWYHNIIALRKTNRALLDGNYVALNQNDPNVLSYLRSYKGENVLVALNMSGSPQKAKFDLSGQGVKGASGTTLASTAKAPAQVSVSTISLEPYGVWIGEVK